MAVASQETLENDYKHDIHSRIAIQWGKILYIVRIMNVTWKY
jgi:hypothetical protein